MNQTQFKAVANTLFLQRFKENYNEDKVYWEFIEEYGYFARFGLWEYDVMINSVITIGDSEYITDAKVEMNIMYRKGRLSVYNSTYLPYSTWEE